jgi:hypothetical protein
MAADLGISMVGIGGGLRVSIRDLIHPQLNEPLKNQQQVTFKLVKTGKSCLTFCTLYAVHSQVGSRARFVKQNYVQELKQGERESTGGTK